MTRFLQVAAMWCIVAPMAVVMYTFAALGDWIVYIFNAPFDVWESIVNTLDGADDDDEEEEII